MHNFDRYVQIRWSFFRKASLNAYGRLKSEAFIAKVVANISEQYFPADTMPFGISRRRTKQDDDSDDDAGSFRRRGTLQFGTTPKPTVELEEDKYSSYNGLMTWEKFKKLLQEKFPAEE